MASYLAGALALMTCKELLKTSLSVHLKNSFQQTCHSPEDVAMMEVAITTCCAENLELGCMLVEKAAMDQAAKDIDESFEPAYMARREHRLSGSQEPFVDMAFLSNISRYPAQLPASLRLGPREGGLTPEQLAVYEAFAKPKQPNSQISSSVVNSSGNVPATAQVSLFSAPQALEKYKQVVSQLDRAVQQLLHQPGFQDLPVSQLPPDHEICLQLASVRHIVANTQEVSKFEIAVVLAQSVFKRLYEGSPTDKLRLSVQVGALEAVASVLDDSLLRSKITEWVCVSIAAGKLNTLASIALIDAKLIHTSDLDNVLGEILPRNHGVIPFCMDLIQACVIESGSWRLSKCQKVLNALRKIEAPGIARLFGKIADLNPPSLPPPSMEAFKMPNLGGDSSFIRFEFERSFPSEFRIQVEQSWAMWLEVVQEGKNASQFVQFLLDRRLLESEDYFTCLLERCMDHYFSICPLDVKAQKEDRLQRFAYVELEVFAVLISFLIQLVQESNRSVVLAMVLESIAKVMSSDVAQRFALASEYYFDERPYFRLLLNLQREVLSEEETMLATFAEAYHVFFAPFQCPGFCFAWLHLVSHQSFMPRLLRLEDRGGWAVLHTLMLDLLRFLEPYLAEVNVACKSITQLYQGTLKVLLVLLHDFPEFLCYYHFSLCSLIPPTCVQLRNLVLSAFPRKIRLPDPFNPELRVDMLPDIEVDPYILSNYTLALEHTLGSSLKHDIDVYIQNPKANPHFPGTLKSRVNKEYERFRNWDCLNSLVLYLGIVSIASARAEVALARAEERKFYPVANELFFVLAQELSSEARYMLLNAIANNLRFPNSHTHFFSCVILGLFMKGSEVVQEQVTRVLLERLIVHRPHPWGLLVTFIELMKNPRYAFWDHSFTRCTPEIEKVFESVASSCGTGQQQQGQLHA